MKKRNLLLMAVAMSATAMAQNPIVQTYYTADPAPMVHDGTVYLYTSHDEDVTIKNFFTMNDWRCYSSKDMVNWTDHGAVLSYTDFEWSRGDAWAGQCVYRNGKYYFYVPVNQKNGGNAIGVAVSDSPTGPFKDALGKPLLASFGYIDPTVFIDDDGQAYLYWGNPNLWYVKLNEDMLSYDQEVGIVKDPLNKEGFHVRYRDADKRPSAYEEAPWLYKRNDQYYLFYAAGGVPEHLAYSTSSKPTGPWVYGDTIMHIIRDRGAFTNHPGVIDYEGKTYLFYHNGALPGGGGFKRSVCVDELTFNPDGSIPVIPPTKEGVQAVRNLNPFKRVEAETIAWSKGLKTAKDPQTGMYVSQIHNGDYLKVQAVDFNKGAKRFNVSASASTQGGSIEIRLDAPDGQLLGTCTIGQTDGWKTFSSKIQKVKGVHDVYLVFKGGSDELFQLDWWMLKK
ncbi:MAG: glycoside hydrolase family 43 protein [Bacteroidales bacterium]|nr:glycoside hydrolase family 43 protein [Bacteroidales bacterium]